jgi:hypothetical protein
MLVLLILLAISLAFHVSFPWWFWTLVILYTLFKRL